MKTNVLWRLLITILLLGNSTISFADEGKELVEAKDKANAIGYGRNVSMDFNSIEIVNKAGEKLKLRDSKTNKNYILDNNAATNYAIPINEDFQISLNGDENSDDIVIRDRKGFVEYKIDKWSTIGFGNRHRNLWINLLTWTGKFWRLNTAQDNVDGTDAYIVPCINNKKIKVMVLKSKNGFGRKISRDFKTLVIKNKSGKALPLRIKVNNRWQDDGQLLSDSSREYKIDGVEEISLNSKDEQDDIKINNDKGYIELLAGSMIAESSEQKNIWINHFWWNDQANKWYGAMSKTNINGNDDMILSALEGNNTNQNTGIINKNDVLLFTILKK